jgi:hypothetical protein
MVGRRQLPVSRAMAAAGRWGKMEGESRGLIPTLTLGRGGARRRLHGRRRTGGGGARGGGAPVLNQGRRWLW